MLKKLQEKYGVMAAESPKEFTADKMELDILAKALFAYQEKIDAEGRKDHLNKMIKTLIKKVNFYLGKNVVAETDENEEEADAKGGNWIKKAINPAHKGALREKLHVPEGKNIPADKLKKAAHQGGKTGQQARLALTLKKLHKK
jgi:hypothetical protein